VTVIHFAFGAGFSLSPSIIIMPLLIWGYKLLEILFAVFICISPHPIKYFKYFFFFSVVICQVHFYRLRNARCGIVLTDGLCRKSSLSLALSLSLSLSVSLCPSLNFQTITVSTLGLLTYASASVN